MTQSFVRARAQLFSTRFWKRPYFWLLVVVIAAGVGYWLFSGEDDTPVYNTAVVERGSLENLVTATGTLQPRDFVDVGAQVSGQLKILHVDVGSDVKKGDLLAEIDATVYAANVDGTRAQLTSQQAQLRDREAQRKLADINYQRQKNLHQADASTRESLESAEASLTSIIAQIDVLKAQIKQTESNLRAQEANLDFANIYAPMDGTVVSLSARQGQTLNANQQAPTIMRIADLSTMTVQTQVSEADISKLRVGMPVYFTTLGSQGRRWYSTLDRIQPTPEVLNNVVLFNALFDVPNEQRTLMTQMSTQVFFVESEARNVLLIPMAAVRMNESSFQRPPGADAPGTEPGGENGNTAAEADTDGSPAGQRSPGERPAGDRTPGERAFGDRAVGERTPGERPAGDRPFGDRARGEWPAGERGPGARQRATAAVTERRAQVQVIGRNGQMQARDIMLGVTNRIQAEVRSGLEEGEVVVTSVRQTGSEAPATTQNRNPGGPGMGGPRMFR